MPAKLLLADDSVTVQRVIALTFVGEGLQVLTAGNGDDALQQIEQERPDIVLADLSMPGTDGYSIAEFVKRTPMHAARTRVVLLTGAFEPVDQSRTAGLGIDGVLAKPFEPHTAIGMVKRLLEQPPSAGTAPPLEMPSASTSPPVLETDVAAGYPFEPRERNESDTDRSKSELDDYFNRLDEALASAGLTASPVVHDLSGGSRPSAPGIAPERGALGSGVGGGTETFPQENVASPDLDVLADRVVRLALERLTDATVREVVSAHVIDVAERLVREEIERIKTTSRDDP